MTSDAPGTAYQQHGKLFMGRIVDWAKGHIPNDGKLRYALYCGLIDEFEQLGFMHTNCSHMDEQFKEAWADMHHWEPTDIDPVPDSESGTGCPICGTIMQRTGNCYTCPECGWNEGCG